VEETVGNLQSRAGGEGENSSNECERLTSWNMHPRLMFHIRKPSLTPVNVNCIWDIALICFGNLPSKCVYIFIEKLKKIQNAELSLVFENKKVRLCSKQTTIAIDNIDFLIFLEIVLKNESSYIDIT
jgi:hypothetical protein